MTERRRSTRRSADTLSSLYEESHADAADSAEEHAVAEATDASASDTPPRKRTRPNTARDRGKPAAPSPQKKTPRGIKSSTGGKRKRDSSDNKHSGEGSESSKQISAQEEADLSSALIAKLLAEDGGGAGGHYMGYYDDYGNSGAYGDAFDDYATGSEADDDWDPSAKHRRASKGSKTQAKPRRSLGSSNDARSADKSDAVSSDTETSDGGESKRKQRKAKKSRGAVMRKERPPPAPVAPGQYRSGAYTDEEEQKFNEGLELYGRAWNQISEHVGTRDPKSIRSHAQKYFIKLFRDKVPLPAKVVESGEGYTLSGRPLDPNSAAARPYLQHVMQLDPPAPKPPKTPKPAKEKKVIADAVPDASGEEKKEEDAVPVAKPGAPDADVGGVGESPEKVPSAREAPAVAAQDDGSRTPQQAKTPAAASSPVLPKSPARTKYAMSRPQRNHARPVALQYNDPHQMVRCTPFPGQPLSGVVGCQPFRLVVHTNAQLQMDFHAHLMLSEVIGLLGGRWDAEEKVLTVTRAFPCMALESEEAHTNVEMDPGSELVVRQQISESGLRVVGWYHSHPTFRPDPSIIDIENQTAYQTLFRDNESSEEPFVGAIVGPYDPELPGPVSVFNWFCVGKSAVDRGHPKRLMVEAASDSCLPEDEKEILFALMDSAGGLKHHATLEEAWRSSSTEMRSLKMAVSLALRMPWLTVSEGTSDAETPAAAAAAAAAENTAGEASAPETPAAADGLAGTETASADGASSDCTASESAVNAKPSGDEFKGIDKKIPQVHLMSGRRAVQDQFLTALGSRFSAGVFKTGADGKISESEKLERVFAAYFMQWGGSQVPAA